MTEAPNLIRKNGENRLLAVKVESKEAQGLDGCVRKAAVESNEWRSREARE